jgi:spoIIIJ-associated protein
MFSLDAGDYRNQRSQELEAKALKLAEEVRESGRTKSIPALNPAERRIVHMTLQNDRTIRSRSVGDGHFKKILIYLPTQGKKHKNPEV